MQWFEGSGSLSDAVIALQPHVDPGNRLRQRTGVDVPEQDAGEACDHFELVLRKEHRLIGIGQRRGIVGLGAAWNDGRVASCQDVSQMLGRRLVEAGR